MRILSRHHTPYKHIASKTTILNVDPLLLFFIRWERKRNGSKEMTEKLFYNFTLENKVESRIALQGNSKIQETTLRNISDRDL